MHGKKIVGQKLGSKNNLLILTLLSGFSSSCVMTKAQGDVLVHRVLRLEAKSEKIQNDRHDMEVLLVGRISDIVDKVANLERQFIAFRSTLSEGAQKNSELVMEIKSLRNELEESAAKYEQLEKDQQELSKSQLALKKAQKKIQTPLLKKDHYALAKKYYLNGNLSEAESLLSDFIKRYPDDKELINQSYYLLGEVYRKLASASKSKDQATVYYKKSVINLEKIVQAYKKSVLKEEALFKMGLVLKAMGNNKGAKAAFSQLLVTNENSNRANEAKRYLSKIK